MADQNLTPFAYILAQHYTKKVAPFQTLVEAIQTQNKQIQALEDHLLKLQTQHEPLTPQQSQCLEVYTFINSEKQRQEKLKWVEQCIIREKSLFDKHFVKREKHLNDEIQLKMTSLDFPLDSVNILASIEGHLSVVRMLIESETLDTTAKENLVHGLMSYRQQLSQEDSSQIAELDKILSSQ